MKPNIELMSEKDLKLLQRSGCPWRPSNLKDVRILQVICGTQVYDNELEEGSFHPNGCSGCVVMPDEYICGVRCDHLIWMTGWDELHANCGDDCLLLLANHKGLLVVLLVYEADESDKDWEKRHKIKFD